MKIRELLEQWETTAKIDYAEREYCLKLPVEEAAAIAALAAMYPERSETEILRDLVRAAVDELTASMPYVQGESVGEDDYGDPVFADAGPSARFARLKHQFITQLRSAEPR